MRYRTQVHYIYPGYLIIPHVLIHAIARKQSAHASTRISANPRSYTAFSLCVEKPGFLSMVKKLDPRYEVISRKYFSKTMLPSLYTETCERVTKELQEAEYYSVTTDVWSSTGKLEPYLAVTVQYINKE